MGQVAKRLNLNCKSSWNKYPFPCETSMSALPRYNNRLTRLGFHFLFLGSFAIFGGAVRGFNLLLVLAAVLIGALLIQWRWS